MNELLMKFYQEVIQYENDSIHLGNHLDEEVAKFLVQYNDKFDEEEKEIIKGIIYQLTYEAQKNGYILGVKSALQIYTELLTM